MAISDQDRKLAEETFDFIERSEASGNSYEANLPIGAPESGDWGYEPRLDTRVPAASMTLPGHMPDMTLADHTDSAIAKILGA